MNDISLGAIQQKVQLTVLLKHLDLVSQTAADIIKTGEVHKVSPEGLGTRVDRQS